MEWESENVNVQEENFDELFLDSVNSNDGLEEIYSSINDSSVDCEQALPFRNLSNPTYLLTQSRTINPTTMPSSKPSSFPNFIPSSKPNLKFAPSHPGTR